MCHENILRFIDSHKHINDEYWLVTEYHEKGMHVISTFSGQMQKYLKRIKLYSKLIGSLCDFLKSNTVSFGELCKIANDIASGLAHLHEELPPTANEDRKLTIAHRDFKSKNVLIKGDLTACIADFGLALIFELDKKVGDCTPQVWISNHIRGVKCKEVLLDFERKLRLMMSRGGQICK